MWKSLAFLLGLIALSLAFPNPQDDQDLLSELDGLAEGDGERYGGIDSNLDAADLLEIFGINEKPFEVVDEQDDDFESTHDAGVPKDIIEDERFKQCSSYAESGYRCVPYYSCENGEIITDGGGLINVRFGSLNYVQLDPETSKCPGSLEMCCRHPDWIGLPIASPIPIKRPDNDIDGPEYEDPNEPLDPKDPIDNDNPSQPIIEDHSSTTPNPDQEYPIEVVDPVDPEVPIEVVDPVDPIIEDPKQPTNDPTYPNPQNPYGDDTIEDPKLPVIADEPSIYPTANGYRPQCGQHNNNGVGVRISHTDSLDKRTQFGEWPHMCAVLNKTLIGGVEHNLYVCGGSLIAPNVILTAAHCLE
jgi:hypothetical protein